MYQLSNHLSNRNPIIIRYFFGKILDANQVDYNTPFIQIVLFQKERMRVTSPGVLR
jgi:hypothetical protein